MARIALTIVLLAILGGTAWWVIDTLARGGTWEMPASTWIFMIVGVVIALGIGFGLMALVFWSNRKGHDEEVFHSTDRADDDQP